MEAVVSSYPNSLLRFPSSSLPKSKFGRPLFSLTPTNFEITDGASVFTTQRNLRQLRISTVRADNNRRDRSLEDEGNNVPQSSHGKESNPSDQEEMIALFRRIGSSISEGESARSKTRRSKASAESLLDVLVQSRKPVTEKTSNKESDKVLTQRCDPSKKIEKIEYYPPAADPKSTRPPLNFVKRSPIQSPVRFNRKAEPESEEESISMVGVEKVEGMKVSELKELAKSSGIKGYSKLKKSELIELLTRSEERNPHPC